MSCVSCIGSGVVTVAVMCAGMTAPAYAATSNEETGLVTSIPDSTNKIMKLGDDGIRPNRLSLEESGSSVFFLNTTPDEKISIEVTYGTKLGYCATGDMKMGKDGVLRSQEQVGPKHFIVVCFPQPGDYPIKVLGLKNHPQGLESTVVVK